MAFLITFGVALVALVALVIVLNRRGAQAPGGDDTLRDAGLRPGTHGTAPFRNGSPGGF
jgi:hypothetical protein